MEYSTSAPPTSCCVLPLARRTTGWAPAATNVSLPEYSYLGRDVWQQVLNLKQDEKVRLVKLLEENYQPENRVYRYNFFYDNCATRPRDMVEKAISGKLVYAEDMDTPQQGTTFRDILRQYSAGHLWSRFGMDLCMGSKADEPISRRVQMFVPFYVQSVFSKARIQDEQGGLRPLVVEERKVVEVESHPASGWLDRFTPQWMSCLLFVLTLCCTLYGVWRGEKPVGHRPGAVLSSRPCRMHPGFPDFVFPTSCRQPQLPAFRVPPVSPVMPAFLPATGAKRADQPIHDSKLRGFNFFYCIYCGNPAEI